MIKVILKYLNEVYGKEKRYGFKENNKDNSQETDRSIELENGDCDNISGYNQRYRSQTNRIRSFRWSQIANVAMRFLEKVQNIFLLITIVICASLNDDNLPTAYSQKNILTSLSIPLLLDMMITLIKEIYFYYRLQSYDDEINNNNVCSKLIRFQNAKFDGKESIEILEKVTWGSLQIGDIVLLNKDEYCPADILILDMWESKCTAKTSFIDDSTDDSIKYAPLVTSISKNSSIKGNLTEYRRILTGKIDLQKTDDISNFRGFLSLKKDPISEKFTQANLLQKYSQVKYTDWLFGIVVLCGNDSYSFQRQAFEGKDKQRQNPSHMQKKWDIQSVVQILMICFFSLIVIILRISMTCFKSLTFKGQMIPIAIDFIFTFPFYCNIFNQLAFSLIQIYNLFQFQKGNNNSNSQLSKPIYTLNHLNPFDQMALNSHVIFNSFRISNSKLRSITSISDKSFFIDGTSTRTSTNLFGPKGDTFNEMSVINSPASNLSANMLLKKTSSNQSQDYKFGRRESGSKKHSLIDSFPEDLTLQLNQTESVINLGTTTSSANGNSHFLSSLKNDHKISTGKNQLQEIIEQDSKTLIQEDYIKSQLSLRKINEESTEHHIQMNSDNPEHIENSLHLPIDTHSFKQRTSIMKLNSDQNLQLQNHTQNQGINAASSYSNLVTRRQLDENDISFSFTNRSFLQNSNQKRESPRFPRPRGFGSFASSSHQPSRQNSFQQTNDGSFVHGNNNNNDSDCFTFMKGSFAPVSPLVGKASGSQVGDSSSLVQRQQSQKMQMISSFDAAQYNHEQSFSQKSGHRSPKKSITTHSLQNSISQWKETPHNINQPNNPQNDIFPNGEAMQQSQAFQGNHNSIDSESSQDKDSKQFNKTYYTSCNFKTLPTGQAAKKYLDEDGDFSGYESDDLKTNEKRDSKNDKQISKKRAFSRQETTGQMKDKFNFSPSYIKEERLIETVAAYNNKENHVWQTDKNEEEVNEDKNQQQQTNNSDRKNPIRLKIIKSHTQKEKSTLEIMKTISDFPFTSDDGTPKENKLSNSHDITSALPLSTTQRSNPLSEKLKNHGSAISNSEERLNTDPFMKRLSISSMLPSTSFRGSEGNYKPNGSTGLQKRSLFDNQNGFEKYQADKLSLDKTSQELLFGMALCHESKSKGNRDDKDAGVHNIHLDQDTEEILEYTKNKQVVFELACTIQDQLFYVISNSEGKKKIQIHYRFTFDSCAKTIVIAQEEETKYLIVREASGSLPGYIANSISSDRKPKIEAILSRIKSHGERTIFYSKKILSEEQFTAFENQIRLESSVAESEEVYQHLITQNSASDEESLRIQFLGFIGIREECDLYMKEVVKELRSCGQKIWVLTSDKQENTISSCYNYKILRQKGSQVVDFSTKNFDELLYKTRNHLEILKNAFIGQLPKNKDKNTNEIPKPVENQQGNKQISTNNNQNQNQSFIRKSTFAEGQAASPYQKKGTNNNNNSQTHLQQGSKRNGLDDTEPQTAKGENTLELSYDVLISGDSLNIIRSHQYLWDHFLLIIFFAGSVVGYELSKEQKSFLGKTVTDKFSKQQQRVVNVVTSLSDIERLNNSNQVSVFIGSASDMHAKHHSVISQHCQIFAKDSVSFLNILLRESRFHAEVSQESMYLAIHRSYLLAICIVFWNVMSCTCNLPLFDPSQSSYFFHGLQFALTFLFYLRRKRGKLTADCEVEGVGSRHFYRHFAEFMQHGSTQQIPILNFKVLISSGIDAVLVFLFFSSVFDFHDGAVLDSTSSVILIQWGITFVSFARVFDLHFIKLDRWLIVYVLLFLLLQFLESLTFGIREVSPLMSHMFVNMYFFNALLFLSFYVAKTILEQLFLSPQPLSIIGLSKYIIAHSKDVSQHIRQPKREFSAEKHQGTTTTSIVHHPMIGATPISAINHKKIVNQSNTLPLIHPDFIERDRSESARFEDLGFLSPQLPLQQQTQNMQNLHTSNGVNLLQQSNVLQHSNGLASSNNPLQQSNLNILMVSNNNFIAHSNHSNIGNHVTTPGNNNNNSNNEHIGGNSDMPSSYNVLGQQVHRNHFFTVAPKKISMVQVIRSIFKDKEMDIILSSMLMQEDINLNQTQMSKYTLKFQIKEIEALFEKRWEMLVAHSNRIFYVFNFIVFDIGYEILVLSKVTKDFSASDGSYVIAYAIVSSAIFFLTALSLTKHYSRSNITVISGTIVLVRSLKFALLNSVRQIITYPTELVLHIALGFSCLRFSHYNILLQGSFLFTFLLLLTETSMKKWNLHHFLLTIGYVSDESGGFNLSSYVIRSSFYLSYLIIISLCVSQKYSMSLTLRTNYLSEHNLLQATIKVKDILSILLPKFIREKIESMKQGQYRVAERQEEVTIVFCDICNFDDLIFNEKTNTVRILDKLYRQFDRVCAQNGLQKIETVGKTYLAAAGITDVERLLKAEGRFQNIDPARRALNFAFDLQKIVKSNHLYLASNKNIIIKVGIHLGPAITGVIGYHKPQFSLIGDTVNTTSRVCSTGISDMITISKEVYQKVYFSSSQYKFTQRDVEAKGKGIMTTYQVTDKKTKRSQLQQPLPPIPAQKKLNQNFNDDSGFMHAKKSVGSIPKQIEQLKVPLPNISFVNTGIFKDKINSQNPNLLEPNKDLTVKGIVPEIESSPSTQKFKRSSGGSMYNFTLKITPERDHNLANDLKAISQENQDQFAKEPKNKISDLLSTAVPSDSSGQNDLTPLGISQNRKGGRMLRKASSMTIVDVQPRFKSESKKINEEILSPLSPTQNELVINIEKQLHIKIELEPENIQLKELKLPLEKLQLHTHHADYGGDKNILASREDLGGSHSGTNHLKLSGICAGAKVNIEQKQLNNEFRKQILKQQVTAITTWLGISSLYFLVKLVVIVIFATDQNQIQTSGTNSPYLITCYVTGLFLIYFAAAITFKRLHGYLSWRALRLLIAGIYLISLLLTILNNLQFNSYMDQITTLNITLLKNSSSYASYQIDSVVSLVLPGSIMFCLEIEIIFLVMTTFKCFYFNEKIAAFILQIIAFLIYSSRIDFFSQMAYFVGLVGIIHLRVQHYQTHNEVRSFNNMKTLEAKKYELDQLLHNLLPSHVLTQFLDSMKKEIPLVCEELDDVTLLFADIAGFTKYSSTTDPIVVVNMLRKLFTDFDDHCLTQNVFKLYTIGDCYVCFGLKDKKDRNPAQEAHNVIRFAFDMIQIIDNVRSFTENCNLQMRIGVHTGKLYGGIVGTEIVRYDVYGVDVLIANKMESNGENGKVMVSEATKKLLEDSFPNEFDFQFKETVHIKQTSKDIDGFLIKFSENESVYDDEDYQEQQQQQQQVQEQFEGQQEQQQYVQNQIQEGQQQQ